MSNNAIVEFMGVPDNQLAYTEWLSNPVTKRVLSIVEDCVKPVGLQTIDGNNALYNHGVFVGMASVLDAIQNMAALADAALGGADPDPMYGAEELMKGMGYMPRNVVKKTAATKKTK
jgi:hypothetical protein